MGAGACRDQSSALLVEDFLAGPNNQGSTPESLDAYFYPFAVRSNETRWSRQSGSNGRASEPK